MKQNFKITGWTIAFFILSVLSFTIPFFVEYVGRSNIEPQYYLAIFLLELMSLIFTYLMVLSIKHTLLKNDFAFCGIILAVMCVLRVFITPRDYFWLTIGDLFSNSLESVLIFGLFTGAIACAVFIAMKRFLQKHISINSSAK